MGEFGFLKELGFWGSLLFLLIAIFLRLFWGINKDDGRGRWVAWLRHDRFARRYREVLDAGLNRLDRVLSPEFPDNPTRHVTNPKTERGRAWSWRLLDLCLLLAVAYPALAILVDWTVTGDAGRLGALELLAAAPDWWRRWTPVSLLVLSAICAMLAQGASSSGVRLTFQFVALGLAGAVAGAFAVANAFAFAGAVAVAFAVAGAFAGAVAGAVAVAFAVAGAFAVADADAGAVAVAGAGAGAFAQDWIGRRLGVRGWSLFWFSVLLFAILAVSVWLTGAGLNDGSRSVLLFLGFLPLLNAWADFASIGLTRWRLRCGVQGHMVLNAAIDAVAGVAILLLLAFAIVATVYFVRPQNGAPLIDLPELFDSLHDSPGQYWWLGFMLFSTLLPTLIHLAIGGFALFTLVSGWLGKPIAAGLMKGDSAEGRFASLALTLCAALAVWVPIFVLWHGLIWGGGALLSGLLDACEWFHGTLVAEFPRGTG